MSEKELKTLPVLALRDVAVFPHMVIPLFVGREKSIKALEYAAKHENQVLLLAQKNGEDDDPSADQLYHLGALGNILQMLKLPDGTVKVLVEGISRAKAHDFEQDDYMVASYEVLTETVESSTELDVLMRTANEAFARYVKLSPKASKEIQTSVANIVEPSRLADTIASHLDLKIGQKQDIIALVDINERLTHLLSVLENEIDLLQVERRIRGRVKKQMERSQREYYLNEQMKAIQKELGGMETGGNEFDELDAKIKKAKMPKPVHKKAKKELSKLQMMSPMSAEATVLRNYLDVLLEVPWSKRTKTTSDLEYAFETLEAGHHGIEKIKERVLEYLAVQNRLKQIKGPILCLVGPPGVGKTSLGKSIAAATGRKFCRLSLGGVRDEAEIRGHRRTYIGSMPGKIIQGLSKSKVKNPVMMLDEIDKMSNDFRGDPSSALLEVLDPAQNNSFSDHYLEVETDLSEVMFVATANTLNIPGPLLDRMEVIRLSGYTEMDKFHIAKKYLIKRKRKDNGLKNKEFELTDEAVVEIIRGYTREAGVRNLEREISKVFRKLVFKLSTGKLKHIKVTAANLTEYLGPRRFKDDQIADVNSVGRVNGLAWTSVGGVLLTVEAAVLPGKGKHQYTGKLGDVMKESIQAAITVLRSRADAYGVDPDFYQKQDVHIHVPEGATPKDGPSAGIGMCTAMVSAVTGIPVLSNIAMTGEITLRGEVLPIGGLKEKLLAAMQTGVKKVLIPHDNEKDLQEVPEEVLKRLEVVPVKWIGEVLEHALERMPESKVSISGSVIQKNSEIQASH